MSPLFTKKEPGARKSGRLKSRNYEMVELTLELRFFFFFTASPVFFYYITEILFLASTVCVRIIFPSFENLLINLLTKRHSRTCLHVIFGWKNTLLRGLKREQPACPSRGSWCPQKGVTLLISFSRVLVSHIPTIGSIKTKEDSKSSTKEFTC